MQLIRTTPPYLRAENRISRIMCDVLLALLPAFVIGGVVLGVRAWTVGIVSVVGAVGAEWLWCVIRRRPVTVSDASAAVTGLLLAMTLPVTAPYWMVLLGDVLAVVVFKALFGGLGQNVFNPALAARACLVLVFPREMTRYTGLDGIAGATPLHRMVIPALPETSPMELFLGHCPGSIGELSAAALLLGGIYLWSRRVISPRIPLAYLGSAAVLTLLFPKTGEPVLWMVYNLLSGGLLLGAIYMATDDVTSPMTARGQLLYGVGCGVFTVLFRYYGLFPEGVTYAILLMNACVWMLDRKTAPPRFGEKKGKMN